MPRKSLFIINRFIKIIRCFHVITRIHILGWEKPSHYNNGCHLYCNYGKQFVGYWRMEKYVLYIGLVAGCLTGLASFPQLLKVWREKSAKEISLVMLVTLMLGLLLWVIYGSVKKDLPLILTNAVSLFINLVLFVSATRFRKTK